MHFRSVLSDVDRESEYLRKATISLRFQERLGHWNNYCKPSSDHLEMKFAPVSAQDVAQAFELEVAGYPPDEAADLASLM